MSDDIKVAVAELKKDMESAHSKIDYLEDKKLSKHEFNGFAQLVENMKSTFVDSIRTLHATSEQLTKNTNENTKAINSLQTTLQNVETFMPVFLKIIGWFGGSIVALLLFIAGIYTKQSGIW